MHDTNIKVVLENLPDELKTQPRFFPVGKNKSPYTKGWSNPDNQRKLSDTSGWVGFDTVGHGRAVDYLFFDFDHVLDDAGNFVSEKAKQCFEEIYDAFPDVYNERSISGHGIHILLAPTPDKFPAVSNSEGKGVLYFDKAADCKLEIFYKGKGRYCVMTGNKFREGSTIPSGEVVDSVLTKILDQIKTCNEDSQSARQPINSKSEKLKPPAQAYNLGGDYDDFRARKMLDCIKPSALEDSNWLSVMTAAKNIGIDYATVDAWNQRDQKRYNEAENLDRWDSVTDPYGIETLHGKAKAFGYSEKDTRREWFKLHPELSTPSPNKGDSAPTDDPIAVLKAELREVAKELADFDAEKDAALEKVRNLETFDREIVFSVENLKAAGFARIFDTLLFSSLKQDVKDFGDAHKQKILSDWLPAVKDKANAIEQRQAKLMTRRNEIQAQIKSLTFAAQNDLLSGMTFPTEYKVDDDGIVKVEGEKLIPICRRPVAIVGKFKDAKAGTIKLSLGFKTDEGWKKIPPQEAAVVFNRNKIVDLANHELPVTSNNAAALIEFLDAFKAENESSLPLTYSFDRCGWHEFDGKKIFLDPRRLTGNFTIDAERCGLVPHLKTVGSLDKWKAAYEVAKKYPVARAIVAASVVPILLDVVSERNFMLYVKGKSRGGKTTAMLLGASAVGDLGLVRSFDGTRNGLGALAADSCDYPLFVDEQQAADVKLTEQLSQLLYSWANGSGRTRADRSGRVRTADFWRTLSIASGEVDFHADNSTEGTITRLLTIAAPPVIMPPDVCRFIRETIPDNYGHALPLTVDTISELGHGQIKDEVKEIESVLKEIYPDRLDEHRRYIGLMTLADTILNVALGADFDAAETDAINNLSKKIFPLIPTVAELSLLERYKDFVLGLITQNQGRFKGGMGYEITKAAMTLGIIKDDDGYSYIIADVLKDACQKAKFDCRKLVEVLVEGKIFVPDDKVEKGYKSPRTTVKKTIGRVRTRCFRLPNDVL